MDKKVKFKPEEVVLEDENRTLALKGFLSIPAEARALVVFAHGSGSGRHSPRNQFVASVLNDVQIATLLMDLLMPDEEKVDNLTREHRFDIELLAQRLNFATEWLQQNPETRNFNIGYIGSSTGAAAALVAAAENPQTIKAVVSRGGRPDLAGSFLHLVQAPTLLIVGSRDYDVIKLNEHAFELIGAEKKIEIVANATHLFEEPGTLEEAARLSKEWFLKHL